VGGPVANVEVVGAVEDGVVVRRHRSGLRDRVLPISILVSGNHLQVDPHARKEIEKAKRR
jgi:hypothetical protein